MSRFQGRYIDDIRLWSDYIDVPPNSENEQYWDKVQCPNPQHDTTKRHFQVNARDGLVHCFAACGISGTYLHAIKTIEGCNDKEARRIIRKYATNSRGKVPTVKRRKGATANPVPTESLAYDSYIPQVGTEYLKSRNITGASIARFGIGWCPDTLRIVIPAKDLNGTTRFLIKRAVQDRQHPKYLYTEGFPKTSLLFGACETALGMIRSSGIVLVEGSLDAIRLHQHGITNTVAILGTGISDRQVEILTQLRPRRVIFFFDKDSAGIANIRIAAKRLHGKYPLSIVRFPKEKSDPAEFNRKEVARAIERAIPYRKFNRRVSELRKVRVI
jgi:DNA primase